MPTLAAAAPIYALPADVLFYAQLVFGLGALGSALYCLYAAIASRNLLPVYIFIGGGLCALYEAWADVLGQAIYPEVDVPLFIAMLGRRIPLYVLFIYLFFFPAPFVALLQRFKTGLSYGAWVKTCIAIFISAGFFEIPAVHFRLWTYFGDYPFEILGFPPVWAFMNGFGVLGGAVVLYRVVQCFKPGQYPWVIALVPLIFFGLHFAVAMPLYSTLNSTEDPLLRAGGFWLSSLLGLGLSLVAGRLVCRNDGREFAR